MPRKKTESKTRKTVKLTYRAPFDADGAWDVETLEITGLIVNAAGALTLFNGGAPIRVLAPGFWADVTLIGEEGEEALAVPA